jgi:hypothetical protein
MGDELGSCRFVGRLGEVYIGLVYYSRRFGRREGEKSRDDWYCG